jgi:hypothetical protein
MDNKKIKNKNKHLHERSSSQVSIHPCSAATYKQADALNALYAAPVR